LFKERFGLDIWHSFFPLPHHQDSDDRLGSGFPHGTIAYLTLPDPAIRRLGWDHGEEIPDPNENNHSKNEFGQAVEFCELPSAEELNRFSKALKFLKLKPFGQDFTLRLGPPDQSIDSDATHGSKTQTSRVCLQRLMIATARTSRRCHFHVLRCSRTTFNESDLDTLVSL
jgi:hypothetical protein